MGSALSHLRGWVYPWIHQDQGLLWLYYCLSYTYNGQVTLLLWLFSVWYNILCFGSSLMQQSFHYDVPAWKNTWPCKWLPWLCTWWFYCNITFYCDSLCHQRSHTRTHTSKNKSFYHRWSIDIHLILMVVKMVNILCFGFCHIICWHKCVAVCLWAKTKQNKMAVSLFESMGTDPC